MCETQFRELAHAEMNMTTSLWRTAPLLALLLASCAQEAADEFELDLQKRAEALQFLGLPTTTALPPRANFEGTLSIVQGRSQDGFALPSRYFLHAGDGSVLELGLIESTRAARDMVPLTSGSTVVVSGHRAVGRIAAASVEVVTTASAAAIAGNQPWVSVLCRFADTPNVTPEEPAWFRTQLSNSYPGMDHFWREVSYSQINLAGSEVAGWLNLPHARDHYVEQLPTGELRADLAALAADCFAAGDPVVDYSRFRGVNLMFNAALDNAAWGGTAYLSHDGVNANIPTTWMPPWGYRNHDVLGQEMGHGFGLKHSSGAYETPYDSEWDVMSRGGRCSGTDPEYGCVGVHTIAFHKDELGWIPGTRKQTVSGLGSTTATLTRLAMPTADGLLLAKIPLSLDGTRFYTVEARAGVGYDVQIPSDGVVIHSVDTTMPDRKAQVVDTDFNGNPNDAAAVWRVGETFIDSTNGIRVEVLAQSGASYWVRITNEGKRLTVARVTTGGASGRVTSTPAGIDCGSDCSENYLAGASVRLTATPGLRSHFVSWTGCDSVHNRICTVNMNNARNVRATFEPEVPGCYEECLEGCYDEGHLLPRECVQLCRMDCR